ncbi:halocyanin domain-containing protein [Haloprofundus salilacus]|uniref:halocyanin domain-containing protein n=1 Tax=Haloprofundus salilacus TaxID=2876190 RepID=UPI001CCF69FF|nr:halocyanin domain-containing protein [Haloprofundus salilacus]
MNNTTRRRFLAATAGVTLGAGLVASPTAAQPDETDLSSWFVNTDGVAEIVDARGQSSVDITVGAAGNGGAFAFDPVAVYIDRGTTVIWTWTGDGGTHNVVAKDGSFESEYYDSSGETFETTLDTEGVVRYACAPHESMGMKGALVVGDVTATLGGSETAEATETASKPTETYDGWLSGTDNYRRLVDRRGESEVIVKVGAQGNGGQFAFDPPAMRVDPGTTVVWEWVGDLRYDVVDPELGYHSEQIARSGHYFAVEFDGHGLSTYECTEYGEQGMRGVVVVGAGPTKQLSTLGYTVVGGGALLFGGPLAYGVREHFRNVSMTPE